jgi:peptidoglycan hydrolase-like protein with peptidoglycan-binding domain
MLRRGSTGADVVDLQELLVQHGATLDADGIFGGLTREAVVDFQARTGLDADGIVGPLTWGALEQG